VFEIIAFFCNPSCITTNGQNFGTAFYFFNGYAITAYHVLDAAKSNMHWLTEWSIDNLTKKFRPVTNNRHGIFSFAFGDDKEDYAILEEYAEVEPYIREREISSLNLCLEWHCRVESGMRVLKNGVSTGLTSGVVRYIDENSFYVTSDFFGPFASFGDSGAVVFDESGRAFGIILAGRIDFDPTKNWVRVLKYEQFQHIIDGIQEDYDEQ
jgi:hypothetical protein